MTRSCAVSLVLVLGALVVPSPVLADALAGSEWAPSELNGVATDIDIEQFVRFESDGRVAGNGGCNQFTGSYSIDGEKLTIGSVAATRMACPQLQTEAEEALFRTFENIARFDRSGVAMTWYDADGAAIARLTQQDWD